MPEKSFITKNVNGVLVLMIFILIVFLIIGATFFQGQFQRLTTELQEQRLKTRNATEYLGLYKERYESAVSELNRTINITEQEKKDLRKVYSFTKEGLGGEISKLNNSLILAEATSELLDKQLTQANAELLDMSQDLAKTKSTLSNVSREYDFCINKRNELQSELQSCENICGEACQ